MVLIREMFIYPSRLNSSINMECDKMKNKKSNVSKVKLNVSYVEFIAKLMREKLCELNPEKLRTLYLENVKVKSYRNILRVSERIKRQRLSNVLDGVLKDLGLNKAEYIKVSDQIVERIREKKEGKYIAN